LFWVLHKIKTHSQVAAGGSGETQNLKLIALSQTQARRL